MTLEEQSTNVPDAPVAATPGFSIAAILSFAGGVALLVLHMTVRLISLYIFDWPEWIISVIGALGLLSVLPILVNIVLGHVGVRSAKTKGKRGRVLGIAGATMGYVLLVLWFNRLILVVLAVIQYDQWEYFLRNVIWYS